MYSYRVINHTFEQNVKQTFNHYEDNVDPSSWGALRESYREELGVIAPGISLRVLVVVDKLNLGQVDAVVVGLQYLLKPKR